MRSRPLAPRPASGVVSGVMPARVRYADVSSPTAALKVMAKMVQAAMTDPTVYKAARAIVADVDARDDKGELQAIFDAVKTGTDNVQGLERGVRYVADPLDVDTYTAPAALLRACAQGACAEDCDGTAMMLAALSGSIGFTVGLRAFTPRRNSTDYEHIYAVAMLSKKQPTTVLGMDTTVPSSYLGWEPGGGSVLTAWLY
jgi:hypothetical protein